MNCWQTPIDIHVYMYRKYLSVCGVRHPVLLRQSSWNGSHQQNVLPVVILSSHCIQMQAVLQMLVFICCEIHWYSTKNVGTGASSTTATSKFARPILPKPRSKTKKNGNLTTSAVVIPHFDEPSTTLSPKILRVSPHADSKMFVFSLYWILRIYTYTIFDSTSSDRKRRPVDGKDGIKANTRKCAPQWNKRSAARLAQSGKPSWCARAQGSVQRKTEAMSTLRTLPHPYDAPICFLWPW